MNYQEFNRDNLKLIRRQFEALFEGFATEHNLEITLKNISFTENSFKVPMEVRIKGAVTREESMNKEFLKMEMERHGLKAEGRNGEQLLDFISNRPKYPFIFTKRPGGTKYKCSLSQAKRMFAIISPTERVEELFGHRTKGNI